MSRSLTPTENAEALARAVALITARRGGMALDEFAQLCIELLLDTRAVNEPGVATKAIATTMAQLAHMAAHACEQWNAHAPEDSPADAWLSQVGTHAAEVRQR